ncbi:unnamed protein product [Closterium sp. NIES-53]
MATIAAVAAARGGQQRALPLPDDPTPQQLREWVVQRALPLPDDPTPQQLREWVVQRGRPGGGGCRCVKAAALGASESTATPGASESAAAPGASESAAALGARESADALGASASTATGPASAEVLHTFTLDSGASRCFFRDCTTVTPLTAPVLVSLADPSGGLVVARASTVLPCLAVPSGSLSSLHLPTFSTNLVSNAAIQDVWVDTFIPGGQRVAICTCSRTGRHLTTFTRQPGSTLYTLTTASAQVAESGQVAASSRASASGRLVASCSCRVLTHETHRWHHRLGHPSLPRLRSMHSRLLVSGLTRTLPPLPRSLAPPCLPCVEGRQRAAPHSSEFPPTTAPLQILHLDADVSGVLIPWIRATRLQLHERFQQDFPVLRLHSDRGGEFFSGVLETFCQDEGIAQSFTLPASPQKNGIAERRIGLIMEVARTSMIHAAAPHFLWSFTVRYAAHQLNLWPVSLLQRPRPHSVGRDSLVMRRRFGSGARSPLFAIPKQDVTFDESVCYYRLHPHASHPVPLAPLFLVPVPPPVDPLPPQGPAPSGVSQVDPPPLDEPEEISSESSNPAEGSDTAADDTATTRRTPRLETPPGFPPRPSSPPPQPAAVDSGAGAAGAGPGGVDTRAETEGAGTEGTKPAGVGTEGTEPAGAGTEGTEPAGAGTEGTEPEGIEPGGTETLGADSGGAETSGADSGGAASPSGGTGATRPGGTIGGTRGTTGAGGTGATAGTGGAGAGGTRGASGTGGARATTTGGTGAGQPPQTTLLETLSPQAIRAWVVRRGSPGGGGYGPAGAGATSPGGTRGAAGAGGTGDGGTEAGGTGAAGAGGTTVTGGAGGTGAAGTGGAEAAGAADPGGAGAAGDGGVGAGGAAGAGGAGGATGAAGTGGTGGTTSAGGAGAGARGTGGTGGTTGARGAGAVRAHGTGGAGATGAGGVARGTRGAARARGTTPQLLFPPADQSQPPMLPHSPLPAPAPYTAVTQSLTERREPETHASTPECREPGSSFDLEPEPRAAVRARVPRVCRPRAPAVPGTHDMTLRPSSLPQRVVLPLPPASSLPDVADPPSDLAHASSPTVTRFLATVVTDPTFSSPTASALVAELVDFAAMYRLDYLASLVSDPDPACPSSVGGETALGCTALGCDVLEDRQEELECLAATSPHHAIMLLAPEGDPDALDIPTPRSYREAISGKYPSQWQTAMDAEMASWKSAGTYVDEVPPPGVNIVSGMWIFKVKRPPGSPPAFKARYVTRGFSQPQRDYELHSLDFSTAFLQGSLHEAIWLRRPQGFTGSFPEGTQWSLRRPVYGLRQAPREWHDTLRTTLAALGFAPSSADPSLFLRTDTTLPPFYILVYVLQRFRFTYSSPQPTPLATGHSLSAPPSDESVEPSGAYPELVGCLMYLMTRTRPDLAYPLSLLARYVAPGRHRKVHFDAAKRVLRYLCSTSGMGLVLGGRGSVVLTGHSDTSWADDQATQRSSQGYTFSLGAGSVSWRSSRSSSMLGSNCEAEIYAGPMAAQKLRWLTYLLTDLGERPRSPPVLYVDNKAMLALCREQRLEHRTKHIALRYFLVRELQQRGQLRLAFVASRANTADVFTKALGLVIISEAVPEELVKKAFVTCGISAKIDGTEDHLILAHMRYKCEVEVVDDVNDLVDDELVVNPFYAEAPVPPEELQAAEEDDAAE